VYPLVAAVITATFPSNRNALYFDADNVIIKQNLILSKHKKKHGNNTGLPSNIETK
jgi:hypothetical protein